MTSMLKIQRRAERRAQKLPECLNILIVDDQRFDRSRLKRLCGAIGHEAKFTEAETLAAMDGALAQGAFDLIFLDYHLPDGTGLEALDRIQIDAANRNAATIMVTNDDQTEIAINAMKNGCSDFIIKDALSGPSVKRASVNALQKAKLNRNLKSQAAMRARVERVLDRFAQECAEDFKPMLVKMVRHVRDLKAARDNDIAYERVTKQITEACDRLLEFMGDIEDHERKAFALAGCDEGQDVDADGDDQGPAEAQVRDPAPDRRP